MIKLSKEFYIGDDVVRIAKELIGKVLVTNFKNQITSGIIVETEAYNGRIDKASHAYPDVRTARTDIMYREGGVAYVYLCYGIHHLFNVVTNKEGQADAVLIRAVEPLLGLERMLQRRNLYKPSNRVTSGPGNVGQALGISSTMTGESLSGNTIWIEDHGIKKIITSATRIGVDYAQESALLKWRFYDKNNLFISV